MLEYYFRREGARVRLARNYLAVCLEEVACRYHAEGYGFRYAQGCLRSMAHFGDWPEEQAILPGQVTLAHARTFLTHFLPPKLREQPHKATKKRRRGERTAVITAVTWLREQYALEILPTPVQRTVKQYADHVRRNRGLCDGTIYLHCLRLETVLTCWFGDGEIRIAEITTERILAYIDALPSTKSNAQRRGTCTALRGYFRSMEMQGMPTQHLCTVIPVLPSRRTALSPTVLTSDDLTISASRAARYAQPLDADFIRRLDQRRPRTRDAVNRLWYGRYDAHPAHYHPTRYRGVNFHAVWDKGTIEFRWFESTLHAGKVKAYVQFVLAVAARALHARAASSRRRIVDPACAKYDWRCFLLRLGLIGEEFRTARKHLLALLPGDAAFKHGRPSRQKRVDALRAEGQ